MGKQLRIIVGDCGDHYSASCASAFAKKGDWAITRIQQYDHLMQAIREEHPDVLILNLTATNMHYPHLTESILMHTNIVILALYRERNSGLSRIFEKQGVRYLPFPNDMQELYAIAHHLCGDTVSARASQTAPEMAPSAMVTRLLQSFGIPANLQGYHYLRKAILYAYSSNGNLCMMNGVYAAVAEEMHSTISRVERSIRNAILQAWENTEYKAGWQFGIPEHHRMTNSEFIAFAVEWLRSECGDCLQRYIR